MPSSRTVRLVCRAAAIAIAIAGVIDPSVTMQQTTPLLVSVRAGNAAATADADRVARQLRDALGDTVAINSPGAATDAILVGYPATVEPIGDAVRVSTVSVTGAPSPNVWVANALAPRRIVTGQAVTVVADVRARGMSAKTSIIALEQQQVEVARLEHRWSGEDDRFNASFIYAPPATGVAALRVVARPFEGEVTTNDNDASVGVTVEGRPLRVLVHEPRPSWAAAFVRRALEGDPAFAVAASVRPSRDVDVTAGDAVPLRASALNRFDAVIVGAPEELTAAQVDALETFGRIRGGAIVLLPDREPAGAAVRSLPSGGFDEVLLDRPVSLQVNGSGRLRASELAVPRDEGRAMVPLATLPSGQRPVIAWWPLGAGRIVLSGALDAWRFRAADEDGFSAFWRTTIASAAIAAPARVTVTVDPPIVEAGARARLRVALRRTEFDDRSRAVAVPSARAELIGVNGASEIVRLWPSSEPGVYEARIEAARAGRYTVHVSVRDVSADAVFLVTEHAGGGSPDDRDLLAAIAAGTGGRAGSLTDLSPVLEHLHRALRPRVDVAAHPWRSAWWILPFAGALCIEWALRRRGGLR